jgi:hypothetical protein
MGHLVRTFVQLTVRDNLGLLAGWQTNARHHDRSLIRLNLSIVVPGAIGVQTLQGDDTKVQGTLVLRSVAGS